MPCYAMPCQTKSCPGLTQSSFLTSTRLSASTSSAASTGVGRGRRRLPETDTFHRRRHCPHVGTCSRGPGARRLHELPSLGRDGQRGRGIRLLLLLVDPWEPQETGLWCRWWPIPSLPPLLLLLRPRLCQSHCRHSRERALGPPQHPISGGPSVQHVVSESCVLWHSVPCTHRSTPLLQAAD